MASIVSADLDEEEKKEQAKEQVVRQFFPETWLWELVVVE
jgi:hypothetical protein